MKLKSGHSRAVFVNKCLERSKSLDKVKIENHLIRIDDMISELIAKRVEEKSAKKNCKYTMSEEEKQEALTLAKDPRLLFKVISVIKRLGVAGEEENVLIIWIAFSSRFLKEPISLLIKGESSSGKSFPVKMICRVIPEEGYRVLSDASQQSFYYMKDSISFTSFVVMEADGAQKVEYPMRVMQSEGMVEIQVTEKDPDTGEWETHRRRVEGPINFIITTTKASIHNENETRNLSIYMDESLDQTRRIIEKTSDKYLDVYDDVPLKELKRMQNFQRVLIKHDRVIIPYIKKISEKFHLDVLRVRRDFNKLVALIETLALVHQYQRKIYLKEGKRYLVASVKVYYIAKVILADALSKTIFEIPPKSEYLIERIRSLNQRKQKDEEAEVTLKDISLESGWKIATIQKWIEPAVEAGFVEKISSGPGRGKENRYAITTKQMNKACLFPDVASILEAHPELAEDSIVNHPLTGEEIDLRKLDENPF